MQIRDAIASDAHRIAQIHVTSWRAAYRGQMPDVVLDNLDVEKRAAFWRAHLNRQPTGTFLAELEGKIIGFCDLIRSRDQDSDPQIVAEIAAIYVDPDFWRQGTGRILCLRALEAARHERFAAVTLWVLASNTAARNFYQNMGFHLDGATKSESFAGRELQEVRYRITV
jgi:ribosomal protein S18 acetylase RimI-like enzyme